MPTEKDTIDAYRRKQEEWDALKQLWRKFLDDLRSNEADHCCKLVAVQGPNHDEPLMWRFELPGARGYVRMTWSGEQQKGVMQYGLICRDPAGEIRRLKRICHVVVDGPVNRKLSTAGGGYLIHLAAVNCLFAAINPGGELLPVDTIAPTRPSARKLQRPPRRQS